MQDAGGSLVVVVVVVVYKVTVQNDLGNGGQSGVNINVTVN